jgi:hypothetical protein
MSRVYRAWPCRSGVVSKWTIYLCFGRQCWAETEITLHGRVKLTLISLGVIRRRTFALAPTPDQRALRRKRAHDSMRALLSLFTNNSLPVVCR